MLIPDHNEHVKENINFSDTCTCIMYEEIEECHVVMYKWQKLKGECF